MLGWILFFILLAVLIAGHFLGRVHIITKDNIQRHEVVFDMLIDVLRVTKQKKLYGDNTENVVRMIEHGLLQMCFDVAGFEAMEELDRKMHHTYMDVSGVRIGDGISDK